VGSGSRAAHHLAGVDTDAHLQVRRELPHHLADAQGRAQRALGVVVVSLRRAEDRHHRIPDVLLDAPPVALDLTGDGREVRALSLADSLRISALGAAREADEIGEEHRYQPALIGEGHAAIVIRGPDGAHSAGVPNRRKEQE